MRAAQRRGRCKSQFPVRKKEKPDAERRITDFSFAQHFPDWLEASPGPFPGNPGRRLTGWANISLACVIEAAGVLASVAWQTTSGIFTAAILVGLPPLPTGSAGWALPSGVGAYADVVIETPGGGGLSSGGPRRRRRVVRPVPVHGEPRAIMLIERRHPMPGVSRAAMRQEDRRPCDLTRHLIIAAMVARGWSRRTRSPSSLCQPIVARGDHPRPRWESMVH
jgi:hypothetical protein